MAKTPNVTRGWKYARRVIKGELLACRWIKLACQWMLDDLEKSSQKEFPWVFDKDRAEFMLARMQLFHHVKGEWAHRGEQIHLEDWQCFHWAMVFGWLNRDDGFRRFLSTLLFIARKNAKTTVAAAVGNLMLTADDEHGAEVYSGATSEKQAWEVFGAALAMAKKNLDFQECYGVQPNASNISVIETNSKFEPLIGKPGEGANPHCSIHDEYHEHKTSEQLDTMKTGMGSRRQPLQVVITSAGEDTTGPCAKLVDEAKKNLDGSLRDDEFFPMLYCRDEPNEEIDLPGDDWDSITAMKKANPNLGVSVFRKFLNHQLFKAKNDPEKQTSYRTKHLNEFVGAKKAYFNINAWNKSARPGINIEQFLDYPCYIGLDLASKIDIAALEILFILGPKEYARFGKYYLPEAAANSGENKHYKTWVDQGLITVTPGEMLDQDFIEADILKLQGILKFLQELAFDPYQAQMLISHLMGAGIPCVEMPPQVRYFSEPMKIMQALIKGHNIIHDGCPIYTWQLSNVIAKKDVKENVYPNKAREENKIDNPVATIMALGRALTGQVVDDLSFIEDPLVLTQ